MSGGLAGRNPPLALLPNASCPALCRASPSWLAFSKQDVDGRDKPGHDENASLSALAPACRCAHPGYACFAGDGNCSYDAIFRRTRT
jgi:hypothetical protein